MSQQIQITGGAKVRDLQDVIIGTSGVLSSVAFDVANGVPRLDSNGKILVSQLPNSVMEYKGTWNAATNTPTLANGTGNQGDVYLCNVAGTVDFGAGPITFIVGDSAIYSGSIWQRSGGATGSVTSVGLSTNGGAITIGNSPITTSGVISANFNGTNLQYVNGAGNLTTFPTLITSIGLSMPSAFSVANSPLTANGTIAVTGAGTTAQYIRGDGSLATFPTIATEAQRLITEVYNETGATLSKGTVVYINGGHGNLPTITKALATGDATSAQTYGIVQTDITNMNNGYVVVIGSLTDLDTSAYVEGTQLYLSSTTAGAWTSVKQYAPAHLVYVAIVTRSHPTQGVVEVMIQNGFEMDELHNVSAQSPLNNQGLFYNTSTSLWENKSIATALGYTPISLTSLSASSPLSYNNTTGAFSIQVANTSQNGYLSSTDWNTFNSKENNLTFYSPLVKSGSSVTIPPATSIANGYLTSTDWSTFNSKQAALSGTGFVKISGTTISYDNSTYYLASNPSAFIALTALSAGTGISYNNTTGVITNSSPDQTVSLTAGAGISVSGTYPSFTIASTITQYTDALARASLSFAAGSGAYNSTTGVITIPTNNNQITNGAGYITGNQTITLSGDVSGSGTTAITTTIGALKVTNAMLAGSIDLTTKVTGLLPDGNISSAATWNAKQNAITLTTTGTSGAATLVGATLNIPQYTDTYTGTVTSVAALTIGTSGTDLSSSVANSTTTPVITLNVPTASATNRGALSSADWTTFNNKQNALTNPVLASGTWTSGYLPKINGTYTIGNSLVQDNGSTVSIITGSTVLSLDRTGGATALIELKTGGTVRSYLGADTSMPFVFFNQAASPLMYLNASGNLGLGVTPSAWGSGYTALQVPSGTYGGGSFFSDNGSPAISANAYNNAGWKYVNTDYATIYQSRSGQHQWFTAPSGTAAGAAITFTQAMTLTASGNLLVGTTTDYSSKLVVIPSSNPTSSTGSNNQISIGETSNNTGYCLKVGYINTGGGYQGSIQSIAGGSGSTLFLNASGGNVLIGTTTNDTYKLDVNGTGRFSGNVTSGSTSTGAQINVYASSYGNNGLFNAYGTDGNIKLQMGALGTNEGFLYTGASNKLTFYSGGALALSLASTGAATFSSSVTAANSITVTGASSSIAPQFVMAQTGGNTFSAIGINRADGTGIAAGLGSALVLRSGDASDYPIQFATANNVRMTIASGGNVGISTTSPTEVLDVNGNIQTRNTFILYNGSQKWQQLFSGTDWLLRYNDGSSWYNRMTVTSGGNVCIGTTSAYGSNLLNVNGGIYATSSVAAVVAADLDMMVFQNTGATYTKSCLVASMTATGGTGSYFFYGQQSTSTAAIKIFSNGNIQNTNNSYGAISDARLKENIKDATPKLDDLMKVKVRNYNLKGESNKQLGVISQELEAIFPNMIEESTNMGENMKIKGVKYSVFVPMLIKAVQELKAEIEILKNK